MRIVLDTNVVASGLLWIGNPRSLLQMGRNKHVLLFTSAILLAELTDIPGRRKFAAKLAAAERTADEMVDDYAKLTQLVRPTPIVPTVLADPDDDHVLACAVAAGADLIVSGDRHLLDLHVFQAIAIATPARALEILTAQS